MLTPEVTCIMPTTKHRTGFIPLAIQLFLQQDYPNATLLILDDGDEAINTIIPASNKITYVHSNTPFATLGDKRNAACSLAKGEIIMHWDDDDWYASDWITKQVKVLEVEQADVCGLDKIYFYRPSDEKCWQYIYSYRNDAWVAGATLAYRKSVWEQHPFQSLSVGEDNLFVWNNKLKVIAHDYNDGFISILHPKNTSPKHTNDDQWKPVPYSLIQQIMEGNIHHYQPFHQEPQ